MKQLRTFVLAALFPALAVVATAEVKPFTFAHISDTHCGNAKHDEQLKKTIEDIDQTFPETAFIIHTGDVTEFGYKEEFAAYKNAVSGSKKKIYQTPGNHDVRWSESGKENFRDACGSSYVSFDHNGVRFILMDVAMLIEQYGHFDGQQMAKLEEELKNLPPDHPAIIAMHHPPLADGHFIDNEYEFADLLRRYNVPLVCDGHVHSYLRYAYNNITFAAGASTMAPDKPSYRVYRVGLEQIEMLKRDVAANQTTTEPAIATHRPKDTIGELTSLQAQPSTVSYSFQVDPGTTTVQSATFLLDSFTTGPAQVEDKVRINLAARDVNPGRHQLVAKLTDGLGATHIRATYFEKHPLDAALAGKEDATTIPQLGREFPLKSGCQSHPVVNEDVLYVGANDGFLRAFDLVSGKLKWESDLKREIVSSPAVTTNTVVVGSLDSNVYCLDKKTGEKTWVYRTGGAVLASPLVDGEMVYVGSGDYTMYALDLNSGDLKWRFAAQKLIKATPALSNGKLFFGAWDNTFYCVDAKTGDLVWKVPGAISSHFSPATSNPATTGTKVIFVTHDYSVRCLDQGSGSHLWLYKPTKEELGPSYSSPVIRGKVAYMGSINGHVVGHDIDTGAKVFDVDVRPEKTDPLFDSIPLIVGRKLYVGSVGGNLYCIDIPGKKVEWTVSLQPGYIFARPVAWKDRILVGTMSDRVFEILMPGKAGNREE